MNKQSIQKKLENDTKQFEIRNTLYFKNQRFYNVLIKINK